MPFGRLYFVCLHFCQHICVFKQLNFKKMKLAGTFFLIIFLTASIALNADNKPIYRNELSMAVNVLKLHRKIFFLNQIAVQSSEKELVDFSVPDQLKGSKTNEVKVSPKPCLNSIQVSGVNIGDVLVIYNSLGQQVMTKVVEKLVETIDVSSFEPGIYYIGVEN